MKIYDILERFVSLKKGTVFLHEMFSFRLELNQLLLFTANEISCIGLFACSDIRLYVLQSGEKFSLFDKVFLFVCFYLCIFIRLFLFNYSHV